MERVVPNHRVVVTGMGLISPLGLTLNESWQNLLLNKRPFQNNEEARIHHRILSRFAAPLPLEVHSEEFQRQHSLKMRMSHQTIANAVLKEALADSGIWTKESGLQGDRYRIGLSFAQVVDPNELFFHVIGCKIHQSLSTFSFFIAGSLAMTYKMNGYPGLNDVMSGGSQMLVLDSYRLIKDGYQDAMIVGGYDQNVFSFHHYHLQTLGYLDQNAKQDPRQVLKPYDASSQFTAPGDGGGFLVLESLEHAKARGAQIICEVAGGYQAVGGPRPTIPHERTVQRCVEGLLEETGWAPKDVDYVNGSGSGLAEEDQLEVSALRHVFQGTRVPVSTFKGNIGHQGIVAGAMESVLTLQAMREGKVPGTANLNQPPVDVEADLTFLRDGQLLEKNIGKVVKLSFGPGNNVVATAFQKFEP